MQLIWLRSDLRLHDNTALSAATQRGPTVVLYLLSPRQWQAHDDAPCKVDFWLRNLEQLSSDLARLNIPLLIRQAPSWEQAPQVLLQLCRELAVEALHVNEEYGIHESRRDAAVASLLKSQGVSFHSYLDQLLFRPGSVLTKSGGYFQVFSQFRKVCYNRLHSALPPQLAAPRAQAALRIKPMRCPGRSKGSRHPARTCRRSGQPVKPRRNNAWRILPRPNSSTTRPSATSRPSLAPVSFRPTSPPVCCRHANACTRRCKTTEASSPAAAPAPSPGSTNCSGASSTNTSWWAIHGCPGTGPSARKPKPWPGAMPR